MKKLLLKALLLAAASTSTSQLPAQAFAGTSAANPGSGWTRVQALPPNTALHVKARTHNVHCRFQSADADTLTCLSSGKPETFQRTDISSIKVPHRTRSTVVGLAAGAGLGAVIGAAAGQNGQIIGRGGLAAIFAVPLGLLGALSGAATDFTSTTIYRA